MSAPTPLTGNSTRCGNECNSPTTTSAACRGDVPGHEPIPVAAAKTLTRQPYSTPASSWDADPGRAYGDLLRGLGRDYSFDQEGAREMATSARPLLLCCAVLLATACTRLVDGSALPAFGAAPNASAVDVDEILLDRAQMRAITGAGDHLSIIPTMDTKSPVDIDTLARTTPAECRFVFAETLTFGPEVEQFHKTTFQHPPKGATISEGVAAYRNTDTARRAFDDLVAGVQDCAAGRFGWLFVGEWAADGDSLHTRRGRCGRDYRVTSIVLIEVTFCAFPESVPEIVMTNIEANVGG